MTTVLTVIFKFLLSLLFSVILCQRTGFAWQGFGSRGATGEASVRSCEKLPLPLRKTMPVDS